VNVAHAVCLLTGVTGIAVGVLCWSTFGRGFRIWVALLLVEAMVFTVAGASPLFGHDEMSHITAAMVAVGLLFAATNRAAERPRWRPRKFLEVDPEPVIWVRREYTGPRAEIPESWVGKPWYAVHEFPDGSVIAGDRKTVTMRLAGLDPEPEPFRSGAEPAGVTGEKARDALLPWPLLAAVELAAGLVLLGALVSSPLRPEAVSLRDRFVDHGHAIAQYAVLGLGLLVVLRATLRGRWSLGFGYAFMTACAFALVHWIAVPHLPGS
jgi:hypothetical protein